MPKVKVAQKSGTISIHPGDAEGSTTWTVKDGTVDVKEEALALFLSHVDGAEVATESGPSGKDK